MPDIYVRSTLSDSVVEFCRRPFKNRMRLTYFRMPTVMFEKMFGVSLPRGAFTCRVQFDKARVNLRRRP